MYFLMIYVCFFVFEFIFDLLVMIVLVVFVFGGWGIVIFLFGGMGIYYFFVIIVFGFYGVVGDDGFFWLNIFFFII